MAAQGPPAAPFIPQSGGGKLLAGDARVAFVLVNEARHRAIESALGCSREQTNVATFVALLAVAHGIHSRWRKVMDGPMAPALTDQLIGTALLRELLSDAAGPTVRSSPQLGNVLLFGVVLGGGLPAIVKGLRGLKSASRSASHKLDSGFRHRYGYLVDVGHRRARHYEKQARAALADLTSSNQPAS